MCIIVYKPEDVKFPNETLYNCFMMNSDGAGFLVFDHKNNSLIVQKGFFTAKALLEAFEPYQGHRSILHFRIGTHGLKDEANCHPFVIREGLGFVHNGVIHTPEIHKQFSDTWHFNESLKRYLSIYPKAWEIDQFGALLGSLTMTLGWSKLAFMDNFGNVKIHGERQGVWDQGCWFSNNSYVDYHAWYDDIDYTGCGIYGGMGRYGARRKYPAVVDELDSSEEDTAEFKIKDLDLGEELKKDLYPVETCPVCQNKYTNYYTKWSEVLNEYVCASCAIKLQDVVDYDEIQKEYKKEDPISPLLLEELFAEKKVNNVDKNVVAECCEACGKVADSFLYCQEEEMWLCDECLKEAENKMMVI